MPREKRQFVNGEIYHVTLRRIADERLFLDESDHFRGIFSIYEFNNSNPVEIIKRRRERAKFKASLKFIAEAGGGQTPAVSAGVRPPFNLEEPDKRVKLVEVLSFSLMPNHIHLLLRQLTDKGISRYMQKLGSGLAAYYFEKYFPKMKKKGHFFQDRFSAAHVESDDYLRVLFVYIHTNPVAIIESGWKEKGIKDIGRVTKFLEKEYRWSSYFDYLGKKNFPSVTSRDFLLEVMGGVDGCRQAVSDWLEYKGEIRNIAKRFSKKLSKIFLE